MPSDPAAVFHEFPVVRMQDKRRARMFHNFFCSEGVVEMTVCEHHVFNADAQLVRLLQDFIGGSAGIDDKAGVGGIGFNDIAVCLYWSYFQS